MTRLAASQARDHFSEILNQVAYGGERVIVGRRGKELAAIVSLEDLRLLEAIEDRLDVRDALAALEEAEREGTFPLTENKDDAIVFEADPQSETRCPPLSPDLTECPSSSAEPAPSPGRWWRPWQPSWITTTRRPGLGCV
jgi:prevent-host-death family protein